MIITIYTDNENSWFVKYGNILLSRLKDLGHLVFYVHNSENIVKGDICFLLSCTKLVKQSILNLNKNNIVVHASDLPEGKGFAPLQWQILQGKNNICLTLFEVVENVDAGPYYLKSNLTFDGYELYGELREKLAFGIISLCIDYVNNRNHLKPKEQSGEESFFRRRTVKDDEINPNKTIKDLFNHFRISDNDNFPLYFYIDKRKYYIKIYSDDSNKDIKD